MAGCAASRSSEARSRTHSFVVFCFDVVSLNMHCVVQAHIFISMLLCYVLSIRFSHLTVFDALVMFFLHKE